jgi:Zn-dependent protease with chaperone function
VTTGEQVTSTSWQGGYTVTDEERADNRKVALLVPALPILVIAAIGAIVAVVLIAIGLPVVGLVCFAASIVLGGALTAAGLLAAPAHVERLLGAYRIPQGSAPRVENLVDGLCATFGVAHPPLFAVKDERVNLAMVATPTGAVMVVTTGLLDTLDLIELEGVIAHGLAHLRLDAVRRGTLAATLPGFLANDAFRHRLAGRGRLMRADEVAACAVRYPVGIASALERCLERAAPSPSSLFASNRFSRTRWLWFDPTPGGEGDVPGELDATRVRAQALAEW